MQTDMTTRQFIDALIIKMKYYVNLSCSVYDQGRARGWLEEMDVLYLDRAIERRNAARIIHEFLRIECGVTNIRDWTNAKKLRDLYDCKVCAGHIAQMVESGIMPPLEPTRFKLLSHVNAEESEEILERAWSYAKSVKCSDEEADCDIIMKV